MAKIYEIAFQLAGKLSSNFGSTFLSAQKHIGGLDSQIKKLKQDMKSGTDKSAIQAQIAGLVAGKLKFGALNQQIKSVKAEMKAGGDKSALQIQLDKLLADKNKVGELSAEIKKLKDYLKSGGNQSALQTQLEKLTAQRAKFAAAQAAADKFKSSVSSAFKSAAITAGVATTAVGAYYASAMKLAGGVMEYAKHARTAAAISGTNVQWYESMSYAAKNCGVSVENFDKSLGKMTINLGEAKRGNKEVLKTFNQLGLSAQELQGMKPEDAFMRITTALNGVTDAAVRTDLARKVFGKIGTSMIPMAKLGADGLKQLQAEAKKMGVVMGDEADKNAKAYQRAKNRFDAVWSGTKLGIGQAIMPGLASGMETIAKLAVKYQPAMRKFAKDMGSGIKEATPEILKAVKAIGGIAGAVYKGAKAFSQMIGGFHNLVYIGAAWIGLKMAVSMFNTGSAMVVAGKAAFGLVGHMRNLHMVTALASGKMKIVSMATKAWALAQAGLNLVMAANPIALAVIAAIALGAAAIYVYKNWDKIKAYFSDWSSVTAAISAFIDGVKSLFMPLFNWISDKWNAIKNVFSSAPAVNVGGSGGGDASLPGHAEGGIFNKEHIARFAEKGKPEAIIPLANRSRGLSVWEQAGRMLGVGKSSKGGTKSGGHSGSGIVYNDHRVFHISGNQAAVQAGIDQSNQSLMSKLEALQSEEERVSYAT